MKISKQILGIVLFFTLSFTLSSCSNKGPIFEKYLKMKDVTWDRFDVKQIEIPIEEEAQGYNIEVIVHCTEQFQYDDLPFYVILTTPSGEERMREVTVPIREKGKLVMDTKADKAESRFMLWKNITISDKGKCKITFENMIPKIQTEGIDEIGIVVTKAK
jgi:gliding motility-associated lipoprotein GldH